MKKSFTKEIWRSITHSASRFWAIFAIVALGAGFFAGLRATAPDMRATGDAYFDDSNMMDIHLISTMGFTEEDVQAIQETEGVQSVMASYTTDVLAKIDDNEQSFRIHALPSGGPDETDDSYMNRPVLTEGRWPENPGECVVDAGKMTVNQIPLGSTIKIEDKDGTLADNLKYDEFQIVGFVNSSYYISFQLGTTSMGNGTLNHYMFISEDDFNQEVYTDLFATVSSAKELMAYDQNYEDMVSPVVDRLESLSKERVVIRYDEVLSEAQAKLDDAKQEYSEKKQEADEKLSDAKKQLDDGEAEIQANETRLNQAEKDLEKGKKSLAAIQRIIEKNEKQFAAGDTSVNSTGGLSVEEKQVQDAYNQYMEGVNTLARQKKAAEEAFRKAQQEIDQNQAALDQLNTQIPQMKQVVDGLSVQIQTLKDQIAAETDPDKLAQLQGQLTTLETEYQKQSGAYQQMLISQQQLTAGIPAAQAQLDQQKAESEKAFQKAEEQLKTSKATLESTMAKTVADAEAEIKTGAQELADGRRQIAKAKQELADGKAEYEKQKQEAEEKLNDAAKQITDGEETLKELEKPDWYVLDRNTNVGFASFDSDTERMESLSTVFPVIFFLVAALVALTSMTRMVDEERITIGTYKALGYSKAKIASKYIVYAGTASVLGSLVGIAIGFVGLPLVIWNSYTLMYTAPSIILQYNVKYALIGCLAAVGCTLGATLWALYSTLMESPANLMQPRAPKSGKRIFLERITPIWRRLGFIQKVTMRNLFRYKKRLAMTVIGIAGCTALLLTGYGIKDSISQIISKQYNEIYQYNTTIELKKPELSSGALRELQDSGQFSGYFEAERKSSDISANGSAISGYVYIPKNTRDLKEFINLQDRVSRQDIPFDSDSVVLTEKIAKNLGVGVGDTITLKNSKEQQVEFTVTGITENYVYHYVYISPELYEQKMGETPDFNEVNAVCKVEDEAARKELSQKLLDQDGISTVSFTEEISSKFDDMIQSLNNITIVLIVCAGMLAFIVLYNLTNINVMERQREIATIKVLGFFDKEVNAYIYRETALLTLIGCALGLGLGVILTQFVIQTVEVNMVMFGRTIEPMSFLWSILFTLVFSVIVNLVMNRKLKKIDMVESLKSVD